MAGKRRQARLRGEVTVAMAARPPTCRIRDYPEGVAVDSFGNLFIADSFESDRITRGKWAPMASLPRWRSNWCRALPDRGILLAMAARPLMRKLRLSDTA